MNNSTLCIRTIDLEIAKTSVLQKLLLLNVSMIISKYRSFLIGNATLYGIYLNHI